MATLFGAAKKDGEAFSVAEKRAAEYPTLEETIDALIEAADGGPKTKLIAIKAARAAVRAKHP